MENEKPSALLDSSPGAATETSPCIISIPSIHSDPTNVTPTDFSASTLSTPPPTPSIPPPTLPATSSSLSTKSIDLPHFILDLIFTFIASEDVNRCMRVCKVWRSLEQEERFGWTAVIAFPCSEYQVYGGNMTLLSALPSSTSMSPVSLQLQPNSYVQVQINKKPELFKISSHWVNDNFGDSGFLERVIQRANQDSKLWKYDLVTCSDEVHKKYHVRHMLVFKINIRVLEKHIESGQNVTHAVEVMRTYSQQVYQSKSHQMTADFQLEKQQYKVQDVPQKQPQGLAASMSLYTFQLHAVDWMRSIEEKQDHGFEYTDLLAIPRAKTHLMIDPSDPPKFVSTRDIASYKRVVKPKGGVLADDRKLGKTLEIIALILANPGDPSVLGLPIKKTIEGAAQKPSGKKVAPQKPVITGRVTKAKVEEAKRKQRAEARANIPRKSIKDEENLFVTNATLVICPADCVTEWLEELEKAAPALDVVDLSMIGNIRKTSYDDVINADIVLITPEMLQNPKYLHIGNDTKYDMTDRRLECVDSYLSRISENPAKSLKWREPIMEHFYWRRIVVDKLETLRCTESMAHYKYHFAWYVSHMPFSTSRSGNSVTIQALHFLGFPRHGNHLAWMDILRNNLIWGNTAESVKDECTAPNGEVQDLLLLDATPFETSLFSHIRSKSNLMKTEMESKVCCHPAVYKKYEDIFGKNPPSIKHMHSALVKHLQKKCTKYRKEKKLAQEKDNGDRVNILTSKLSKAESRLEILAAITFPELYKGPDLTPLARLQSVELTEKEQIIEPAVVLPEATDYFNMIKEKESLANESARIDLMDVAHLRRELRQRREWFLMSFRKPRLQTILKTALNIPIEAKEDAKRKLEESSTDPPPSKKPKTETETEEGADDEEETFKRTTEDKLLQQNLLRFLVQKHGTKLGNIIYYLKKTWTDQPHTKVLILSQYDKFLDMIVDVLKEDGIGYAVAEGSSSKNTSPSPPIRVLLLNIEDASTEASTFAATLVIFADVFHDGPNMRSVESKAVTVARFIMKNTVESTAYETAYGRKLTGRRPQRTECLNTSRVLQSGGLA